MQDLLSLPLFRNAPPEAVSALAARAPRVQLPPGKVLFLQGDEAKDALLLLSGALVTSVSGARGTERPVGEIHPGELAGEQALLVPGARRSATVMARAPSVGLVITPALLLEASAPGAAAAPAVARIEAALLGTLVRRQRTADLAVKRIWLDELKRLPEDEQPQSLVQRLQAWIGRYV